MNGKYGLLVSRITVTGLIVLFSFGCETESDSTGKDVVEFSTVLIPAGTFAVSYTHLVRRNSRKFLLRVLTFLGN